MSPEHESSASRRVLLVMSLAIVAALTMLTGCGGNDGSDEDRDATTQPVQCASSAVCTQ